MFLIENVPLAISILAVIVIPLSVWGVTVEKRFVSTANGVDTNKNLITGQEKETDEVKKEFRSKVRFLNKTQEDNHKAVMEQLHQIQLQLKDKIDRE